MIPDKGHGKIVLHHNEDGSLQLRDNLSMMWCACGGAAVEYYAEELPQYQFKCIKCSYKYRSESEVRRLREQVGQMGDSIDLIRALIQFEGNYKFISTTTNYEHLGGICFSGNHNETKNSVNFVLDKEMVESLKAAKSIEEVIEIYRGIGFFSESGGTGE